MLTQLNATKESERKIPWVMFVLLTVAFFIALHDPVRSHSIGDDYLPSEEKLQRDASDGNAKRQIGFLMVGGFGAIMLIMPGRRPLQMNGILAGLMLFFGIWMLMSILWADERGLTARRLVVIATLASGALGVALRMNPREIMLLVLFSSMAYLVAGIISEIALGSFMPTVERYRFAGTIHPNNQGVNCSLVILAAITAFQTEKKWRGLYVACAGFAMVFLLLTKSRTSLLSFLITLALYLVLVYAGSPRFMFSCCVAATVGFTTLLFTNGSIMPALQKGILLGRTDQDIDGAMALTGRLPLWEQLIEYAAARPIQGYGYGSFFTVEHIREITARQGWPIAECHNVFLEVLMGLGLVGMCTYALIQVVGYWGSISYFRATRDPRYAFLGSLLMLGVVGGLTESTLLVPTMQTFVQFLTLSVFGLQAMPDVMRAKAEAVDTGKFSAPKVHAKHGRIVRFPAGTT
ncbi:MAG TPA: O-antigen ligase family protein [Candidatus Hydrogenedentes bacterium]|nr:O-antigen ligase family protein [Candidatus Hydrogenedentota bacterium]